MPGSHPSIYHGSDSSEAVEDGEAPTQRRVGVSVVRSRRWVVLTILVAVGFVSGMGASSNQLGADARDASTGPQLVASFEPIPIEDLPLHRSFAAPDDAAAEESGEPDARRLVVTKGSLAAGQSLSGALRGQGISPATVHRIVKEVGPVFDFRNSRPGHRYRLAVDSDQNVVDFRYWTSLEESIYLYWDGESYVARRERAELKPRTVALAGLVETSLYDAIRSLGEKPQLADDFAEIFAWDLDFTRNVKSGDTFSVLYERLYLTDDDGEEIYIRPGRIHAARYEGSVGTHTAVYFETDETHGSYFRPDGSSVERAFLVAPLRYSRISSTYAAARRHPILNVTRRHPGIDYAAAEGTQLWAVADGTVIYRGWAGASGNLVKIRHANGYVSHYAHLARFKEGLQIGERVHQKEVIGYVGHTGLATGPHVCFRVTRNGRYVNPLEMRSPASSPIDPRSELEFAEARDGLLADLDGRTLAASDEAL